MRLLSILLITIFLITGCQLTIMDKEEYLKQNNEIINLNDVDDFSGLEILKDNLKGKEIIFAGEFHAVNLDDKFKIKLVKYLKQEIDLKYYLMETSYSYAYFLNKYLESGDEEILKTLSKETYGTFAYNKDDYNFIKELYEFNKTLDDKDKIKIVGMDIEHLIPISYKYLTEVLSNENIPIQVKKSLDYFNVDPKELQKNQDITSALNTLKENAANLLNEINENQLMYKNLLKEEFVGVKLVLENIITLCDVKLDTTNFVKIREERIYENFKVLDENLEDGKYFGQWGGGHLLDNMNEGEGDPISSVACRLREDPQYTNKVLSILYTYNFSKNMSIENTENGCLYYESLFNTAEDEFRAYNKSDCYIFDINKRSSPYEEKAYIDYIVMFNYSKASKPLTLEE